ncbi:radical SAM protein [Streptomyces sp. SID13666]|uniref:radical SAM protein n=1 Tax=unclassified Streptomyces TaxID=2593676 RepID=UPI0013C0AA5B|nr:MULTISPECIES: radical SAM protein [unclassified Streptomyces]NEA55336.1 radical SAM protein [Streptomyces sp. SID13666]NEA73542.1 radical SAM protein [Streptomyces sp. SID13588]
MNTNTDLNLPPATQLGGFHSALVSTAGHCKIACGFCLRPDRAHGFLDIPTYTRTLSRLKEFGIRGICLTGGEPTHHPDLRQLVRLAHQFGMPVSMVTSARTEAEVSALEAIAHLLHNVTVSADSERARVLGRTTRTVPSAVATLQGADTPTKILHLTCWQVTAEECREIAEHVVAAGVELQLSPVTLDAAALQRAGMTATEYLSQHRIDAQVLNRHFRLGAGYEEHLDTIQAATLSPEDGHPCCSPTVYVSAKGDLRRCPYGRESSSVLGPRADIARFLSVPPQDRVSPDCAALCRADV